MTLILILERYVSASFCFFYKIYTAREGKEPHLYFKNILQYKKLLFVNIVLT